MFNNTIKDYRIIDNSSAGPGSNPWRKRPRRLLIFSAVFLPLLAATQIFIFLQPAVYSSKATVLTTAPADVDQISPNADPQHVNIQKQILIGPSLLEQTAVYLQKKSAPAQLTADDLKAMLAVEPVPETNLVQLIAEGGQPRLLQSVVNAWIEVYLKARAYYISENTDKSTAAINEEITLLNRQVEDKSTEVEKFRMAHDILTQESADNQAHARLQGLNQTLNTAQEEEVKAQAKLDTVRSAIAQGKAVVPDNESQGLADMMQRVQILREKVADLKSKFTPEYIQLNPKLRSDIQQLTELEKKVAIKMKSASRYASQEAENNYIAARKAVKAIKEQLSEHKQKITEYTSQFTKFKAMEDELTKLEELRQKAKQRLVEIEVKQRERYPQVDVVEWASLPDKPDRPNYPLQSAIAFAACLILGLLTVWIAEYLSREQDAQHPLALAGIHLYHDGAGRSSLGMADNREKLIYDPVKLLPQDAATELAPKDTAALFRAADRQTMEILSLLLNGLSAEEIVNLTPDCFDLEHRRIHVPSRSRYVNMNRLAAALLTEQPLPEPRQTIATSMQEIDSLLVCAAIDGGLPGPEQVNAEAIRYSYMLFLVRQGIKLADLAKIFGPIAPARLVELGKFSPEQAGIPIEEVDTDYPLDA